MRKVRGFTLIEMLVVTGIIGALTALVIPVLAKARARAMQTQCAGQLHGIAQMLQMYLGENHNLLPRVNTMPSLRPVLNGFPSLVEVLVRYDSTHGGVFRCPTDRITQVAQDAPGGFETYFAREQSSYCWDAEVNIRASHITEVQNSNWTCLMQEYEPFHGRAGVDGSMNRLYADLHVEDSVPSEVLIGG